RPDVADLFLAKYALRIEVADAAAFGAGRRVKHRIDEGGLARVHRRVHGALQFIRRCRIDADAAKSLHHLVVARAFDEHGRRRVWADVVNVSAAINAVVVEDDDADRQLVTADGLDFHARETERAAAFDREHGIAGLDGSGDGIAHA